MGFYCLKKSHFFMICRDNTKIFDLLFNAINYKLCVFLSTLNIFPILIIYFQAPKIQLKNVVLKLFVYTISDVSFIV